jgi:hypothetical protein
VRQNRPDAEAVGTAMRAVPAAWVASALRAGASYAHGRLASKLTDGAHPH